MYLSISAHLVTTNWCLLTQWFADLVLTVNVLLFRLRRFGRFRFGGIRRFGYGGFGYGGIGLGGIGYRRFGYGGYGGKFGICKLKAYLK